MRVTALSCALMAVVAGCGPSGEEPPILTLAYSREYSPNQLALRWTRPAGEVSAFVVEIRHSSPAFRRQEELGPNATYTVVDVATLPELAKVEFRVRAEPRGTARTSNVVEHFTGLTPPLVGCLGYGVAFCELWDSRFLVTLANRSRIADTIILERAPVQVDGTVGPWAAFRLPAGTRSFEDRDLSTWTDGAHLAYRATAVRDTEHSATVRSSGVTVAAPLLAPVIRSLTGAADGVVRLSVENRSSYTPEIQVYRRARTQAEPVLIAVVPAPAPGGTVEFADPGRMPGPIEYSVRGWYRFGSSLLDWRWSELVTSWTAVPPSPGTGFGASIVAIAPGTLAARSATGDFAVVGEFWFPTEPRSAARAALPPGDLGLFPHAVPRDGIDFGVGGVEYLSKPGLVVDDQGQVHTVYVDVPFAWDGVSDVPIVHAWHDGQSWQSEVVARRRTYSATFDLGADGVLRVCWSAATASDPTELAERVQGVWRVTSLDATLPEIAAYSPFQVLTDGARRISVALHGIPRAEAFFDGNAWRVAPIPCELEPGPSGLCSDTMVALAAGVDYLAVAAVAYDRDTRAYKWLLRERGAAGWGATEILGADLDSVRTARSGDGARVAIAAAGRDGIRVRIRSADGVQDVSPLDAAAPFAVGFDPRGKLWLLSWLEQRPGAPGVSVPAVLYEEL